MIPYKLLPLALLLSVSLLSAAEPALGPERALVAQKDGPSIDVSTEVRVGAGEDGFFAVWMTYRGYDEAARESKWEFLGTRIDSSGRVLDPLGIHIAGDFYSLPVVEWAAPDYVVSGIDEEGRTMRWAVAPDGSVRSLGLASRFIESKPNANGEKLVIGTASLDQVSVWFVDGDGVREDPAGIGLRYYWQVEEVFPAGDDWIVVMRSLSGLEWLRVRRGRVVRQIWLYPANNVLHTGDVATDGANVAYAFLMWNRVEQTFGYSIITPSGAQETVTLPPQRLNTPDNNPPNPPVTAIWDGTAFVFAYSQTSSGLESELRVVRAGPFAPEQYVIDTVDEEASVIYNADGFRAAMASGSRNIIVWQRPLTREPFATQPVYAQVFDRGAAIEAAGEPLPVSRGGAAQYSPRAAANGSGVLLTWLELDRTTSLWGRFSPALAIPRPDFVIADGGERVLDAQAVAVAGDTFLVAWRSTRWRSGKGAGMRLQFRRFTRDGAVDAAPVTLRDASQIGAPSIVTEGDAFRIVWTDGGDVFTATVPRSGAAGAPAMAVPRTSPVGRRGDAVAATAGGTTMIFWLDEENGSARRLRFAAGENGAFGPPAILRVVDAGLLTLGAAAGDGEFLVLWNRFRSNEPALVSGMRVSRTGQPLDAPFDVATTAPGLYWRDPSVAWDGKQWWAAWTESSQSTQTVRTGREKLSALYPVSRDGVPGAPLALADASLRPFNVSLAATAQGLAVLYARSDHDQRRSPRVFARIVDEPMRGRAARH